MFIGREYELSRLGSLWKRETASLVTCRGRRRIGKSTLIREFALRSDARLMSLDGMPPHAGIDNAEQLDNIRMQLQLQTNHPVSTFTNWLEAWQNVAQSLNDEHRTVLLLDEISWMGAYDPGFSGYLKIAWDKLFCIRKNLIVVLCGSVSTWISENILNNTGFVGRRLLDLQIGELELKDAIAFWGKTGARTSSMDFLDVLSVTGCIPRYLEYINPTLSAEDNIRELCFQPDGALFKEFPELFGDIFGIGSHAKRLILQSLSDGNRTNQEIAQTTNLPNNGILSKYLNELEIAGFVSKEPQINLTTGNMGRKVLYRLRDNYVRFYLHFIKPQENIIEKGLYKLVSLEQLNGWNAILGLQFENLVLNHLPAILPLLGLDNSLIISAAPYRKQSTKRGEGCQIDLLILTKRAIYLIEIKRQKEIDFSISEELQRKLKNLHAPRELSVRTALVYAGHLSPLVQSEAVFDFLIPIEKLLT